MFESFNVPGLYIAVQVSFQNIPAPEMNTCHQPSSDNTYFFIFRSFSFDQMSTHFKVVAINLKPVKPKRQQFQKYSQVVETHLKPDLQVVDWNRLDSFTQNVMWFRGCSWGNTNFHFFFFLSLTVCLIISTCFKFCTVFKKEWRSLFSVSLINNCYLTFKTEAINDVVLLSDTVLRKMLL